MNLKKRSSLALSEISVQRRFTINALLKWFYNIYKSRFVETDTSFGPLTERITFYD